MNNLVSIIITTYNRRDLIQETIQSCLQQTYSFFEIIVVDDGSTDDTKSVLDPYINSGQVIYHYKKNEERAAARNTGMKISKGQYIKFLDSDDLLEKEYLQICLDHFDKNESCELIYTNFRILMEDGKTWLTANKKIDSNIYEFLWESNNISLSSVIMRKSVFVKYGGFDETITLSGAEDWEYWIRLSKQGCSICFVSSYVSIIRFHKDNGTMNDARKIIFSMQEAARLLQHKMDINPRLIQKLNARLIFLKAVYYNTNCKRINSLKYLSKAVLKNYSFSFKQEFWILFAKNLIPKKITNYITNKFKYSKVTRA